MCLCTEPEPHSSGRNVIQVAEQDIQVLRSLVTNIREDRREKKYGFHREIGVYRALFSNTSESALEKYNFLFHYCT
jgi:hypothetical protein